MKLSFFSFNFKCHIPWRKSKAHSFTIGGYNTIPTGVVVTAYLDGTPVFNLLMDRGHVCASPQKHPHEWFGGRVRWGFTSHVYDRFGTPIISEIIRMLKYNKLLDEAAKQFREAHTNFHEWSN